MTVHKQHILCIKKQFYWRFWSMNSQSYPKTNKIDPDDGWWKLGTSEKLIFTAPKPPKWPPDSHYLTFGLNFNLQYMTAQISKFIVSRNMLNETVSNHNLNEIQNSNDYDRNKQNHLNDNSNFQWNFPDHPRAKVEFYDSWWWSPPVKEKSSVITAMYSYSHLKQEIDSNTLWRRWEYSNEKELSHPKAIQKWENTLGGSRMPAYPSSKKL